MKRFSIKGLVDWSQLQSDQILAFTAKGSARRVTFTLNAGGPVRVYAAENAEMEGEKFIGAGEGLLEFEVSSKTSLFVQVVQAEASTPVMVKTNAHDHLVEKVSFDTFTGLEMRRQRNPELERMMLMMKQNEAARDLRLNDEIARLRAALKTEGATDGQTINDAEPILDGADAATTETVVDTGDAPASDEIVSEPATSSEPVT